MEPYPSGNNGDKNGSSDIPSNRPVLSDGETISCQDWIHDSSKSPSTRKNRERVLTLFAQANGKTTPEEVFEEIRFSRLNIYQSARHFVDFLRDSKIQIDAI